MALTHELGLTFPTLLDQTGNVARSFGVHGLPASYLIDRDQALVARAIGVRDWDSRDARAYIEALLGVTK